MVGAGVLVVACWVVVLSPENVMLVPRDPVQVCVPSGPAMEAGRAAQVVTSSCVGAVAWLLWSGPRVP